MKTQAAACKSLILYFRIGLSLLAAMLMIGAISMPDMALAQGGGGRGQKQDEDPDAKAKKDAEWQDKSLDIAKRRAEGPCPYVKVLYDAARYIDFDQGVPSSSNVRYSGEINGVSSDCAYKGDQPITVEMRIGFSLGRGPKAEGTAKTYRYWVAVTERNSRVLAKEYFDLPVNFDKGDAIKVVNAKLENIVIPRAATTVSGANFEVLIGFDVTPEMAAFNAEGKRFRVLSSNEAASSSSPNK